MNDQSKWIGKTTLVSVVEKLFLVAAIALAATAFFASARIVLAAL